MEFDTLERCAAYVAARGALAAVHRAALGWPCELADHARRAAVETVMTTAESMAHDHASAGRRQAVRQALATALELAATCDVARALGHGDDRLDLAQRHAGRTIALLGLLFHAAASPFADG